jgi:uncharacterized protein with gpF-like domain
VSAVKARTGIDVAAMSPLVRNRRELEIAAQWSVDLITDLNDDMRKRVRTTLINAQQLDLSQRQIARALASQAQITRKRARLIATDQTQKIAAKLNQMQQR